MNKIYFLILANNEVKTIEKEIYKILKLSKKLNFKLVVVQDGSTDGTFELLEKISKKNKIILFNKKKKIRLL